jgi:hypothetical protein
MPRIELRLDERTRVHREDGLLDRIDLYADDLAISLIVGPAGARVASETGAHLLAAGRRQYVPTTAAMTAKDEQGR